jgi:hypothetical protein
MLTPFDWIRRAATGAELLATLTCLAQQGLDCLDDLDVAEPYGALYGPCLRCWMYPRDPGQAHCPFCRLVLAEAQKNTTFIRQISVLWGYANQIPNLSDASILGRYVIDDQRFLLMLPHRAVKPWLELLLLETGLEMRGVLQLFPTMGAGPKLSMGDILCRAIHHEANLPRAKLWIRFYSAAHQLIDPRKRKEEGILNFEASELIRLMDMAEVFRALLRPEQQKMLQEILSVEDLREQAFLWGRFSRQLDQRVNDMLNGWHFRQWSPGQVKLLYELVHYVPPPGFH